MGAHLRRGEFLLGTTAARWHLLLWDPWWLLGGILFAPAAWGYGQRTAS